MNTDTYQNALESTKDSIEDVNSAIGFSLGNLTLEKLITSAITLVICVLVIWLVMRVAAHLGALAAVGEPEQVHPQGAQDRAGVHGHPHRGRQSWL